MVDDLPNFGTVWFNPKSLANILSLCAVCQLYRVTMDTYTDIAILVHHHDGTIMRFTEYHTGLYYFDSASNSPASSGPDYCFIDTVSDNLSAFTCRKIEGANTACELYRKLSQPSQRSFEHFLSSNIIRNCPITANDARHAFYIYGPDLAALKGKIVQKKHSHVPVATLVGLPQRILHFHPQVILAIDFFFVQGYPFFHTISRSIKFCTTQLLPSLRRHAIIKALQYVMDLLP